MMRHATRGLWLFMVVACSSKGDGSSALASNVDAFVPAECDWLFRCCRREAKSWFGDVAACNAGLGHASHASFGAAGVNIAADQIDASTQFIRTLPCNSTTDSAPACDFKGTKPVGASCDSDL